MFKAAAAAAAAAATTTTTTTATTHSSLGDLLPHPPGSGVYMGLEECLMYCVEWKTLKARPARKSREERSPATGRRVNPVVAVH